MNGLKLKVEILSQKPIFNSGLVGAKCYFQPQVFRTVKVYMYIHGMKLLWLKSL